MIVLLALLIQLTQSVHHDVEYYASYNDNIDSQSLDARHYTERVHTDQASSLVSQNPEEDKNQIEFLHFVFRKCNDVVLCVVVRHCRTILRLLHPFLSDLLLPSSLRSFVDFWHRHSSLF